MGMVSTTEFAANAWNLTGRREAAGGAAVGVLRRTAATAAGAEVIDEPDKQGEQVAQTDTTPAPEPPQPAKSREPEGTSQEAPPGIEVMHIKGKGVGQIE